MKVCVVVSAWSVTGVPLAQRRFAIALASKGYEVDFIIGQVADEAGLEEYDSIRVIALNAKRTRQMILPLARYLKTSNPDVVFSSEDHLNGIVLVAALLANSKAKISGSSRVPPSDSYSNRFGTKGWLRKIAMLAILWRADALTCVSEDMVLAYRKYFPRGPHTAAFNIVLDSRFDARAAEVVDHEWFIKRDQPIVASAGTLTGRKNFRMLINSVAELKNRGVHVRLAIFGEGYRRPELEDLISKNMIADRVWMPGRVANPLAFFSRSDVIALTSYAEGLPNVLVEGMLCGCTPVATDCPTGPREVIGTDGLGHLVPIDDVESMATAIQSAIANPTSPVALRSATKQFSEDEVISRHFSLLGIG